MPTYNAPVNDTKFLLNSVFKLENYSHLNGFDEVSEDLVEAILEEGAKLAQEVLHPLNAVGDSQGCVLNDGQVKTPEGFIGAYNSFKEGGWIGMGCDPDYGGQGLPFTITSAMNEFVSSANMAFAMYPGLSQGAIAAIHTHGTDEQKQTYLPKMVEGEWSGTMNLTEPHCGTDLGLLKSKAVSADNGSYKISGTKIFISAGDHDLTDNVIHLVLARIEGAPEGVKGISLFIVPKFLINEDGSLGARNGVECARLEEKMGIHGNSTCEMRYEEATGYLIGEENRGLNAMFVMMNEARLGVAIQGLAQSEIAYQNAVSYALDRRQGRALTGAKEADAPADPIIVHPDIRKNLMRIKAFNEGGRALIIWGGLLSDIIHRAEDEKEKQKADDLLGLITPVLKGYLTDVGFDNTVKAQQVYGGHGYITEWGMDQFVRDSRIAMIYEGANGIQALDLVGRKLSRNGGRAIMTLFGDIDAFVKEHEGNEKLTPYLTGLKEGRKDLEAATMWFMQNAMANPDNAGAGSSDYMHMMGLTIMAYMWAQIMVAVQTDQDNGNGSASFLDNKAKTAEFFMAHMMPDTKAQLARIQQGAAAIMALEADQFVNG